jgi:hypothetical protein
VQNIDMMTLAGFCRNCLSRWYAEEAAAERGITIDKEDAREIGLWHALCRVEGALSDRSDRSETGGVRHGLRRKRQARRVSGGTGRIAACLPPRWPVIGGIGAWGVADPDSMVAFASAQVDRFFTARGWFVMLSVTADAADGAGAGLFALWRLRLGPDDSRARIQFRSWLAMLFAAGMGVGLLFWATAEPLSHFALARRHAARPAGRGRIAGGDEFHWGLHAWAIYGVTALAIAYFTFRRGTPMLVGAPFCICSRAKPGRASLPGCRISWRSRPSPSGSADRWRWGCSRSPTVSRC